MNLETYTNNWPCSATKENVQLFDPMFSKGFCITDWCSSLYALEQARQRGEHNLVLDVYCSCRKCGANC